jgi:hypothetical protein
MLLFFELGDWKCGSSFAVSEFGSEGNSKVTQHHKIDKSTNNLNHSSISK